MIVIFGLLFVLVVDSGNQEAISSHCAMCVYFVCITYGREGWTHGPFHTYTECSRCLNQTQNRHFMFVCGMALTTSITAIISFDNDTNDFCAQNVITSRVDENRSPITVSWLVMMAIAIVELQLTPRSLSSYFIAMANLTTTCSSLASDWQA